MSLEDTISRINENRLHSSYLDGVLGNNRKMIPRFVDIAVAHFSALENNEEVTVTEEEMFKAKQVLDLCKMIVIELPITEELKQLVQDVCLLVHNWNQNLEQDHAIVRDIKFIRSAVDMHFSMIELLQFTKAVVHHASKKKVVSKDRTDEISRHFLQAVDALQEGCNCEDICS